MNIFSVFTLLGGLAMFLFGMNVMGEALEKQAGGRLKAILERLTANKAKGFLLGLGVTAVIQSSSATTVMVVGFVNSGIMKLSQAISIIMGANVGTTVTAWILSLTGLQGDGFLIQLLKPSTFSPILALIGIILYMFAKNGRKKDTGTILLGFAVLMFGMETMSGAVKPLADVPEFTNILLMFSNPILGVLAGAVLTGIIQSSSASVGILQALSTTGQITFGSAIPIILGQNIGTCVTAMLSSIGANKNARRTAVVHLYFNIIGTVAFLILFYILRGIFDFAFVNNPVNEVGIAVVHTTFNLLATALMLPFTKGLEKLAYLTIREDARPETQELLDERLLATPSVALSQCHKVTTDMALLAREVLSDAAGLVNRYDPDTAAGIQAREDRLDWYEDKLGTYLVKLSAKSLSDQDSREISTLLHIIGDFERIGDHAVNITDSAKEMNDKNLAFSDAAKEELAVLTAAVEEVVSLAVNAFTQGDLHLADQVEPLEEVIDVLRNELRNHHIKRLQKGLCTLELGFVFSDLLTNFERTADHCSNIAVCLIQVGHDSFDTHAYLNRIKAGGQEAYDAAYAAYAKKYSLS